MSATYRALTFPAVLWFSIIRLFAQSPEFQHLTEAEGLMSNTVNHVLQDRNGYLWFSTSRGVSRYNGYDFTHFSTADGLPENYVDRMYEDVRGRLWVLTRSSKLCYFEGGEIRAYAHNEVIEQHVGPTNRKASIHVDHDDNLYMGTWRFGQFRITPDGRYSEAPASPQEVRFHLMQVDSVPLVYRQLHRLIPKPEMTFHLARDTFTIRFDRSRLMKGLDVWSFRRRNGRFLIGAVNTLATFSDSADLQLFYFDAPLCGVYEDRQAHLWVSLFQRGVWKVDRLGQPLTPETNLLPGRSVTSILQDRAGGYWFTTKENGVYHKPHPGTRHYPIPAMGEARERALQILCAILPTTFVTDSGQVSYADREGRFTSLQLPGEHFIDIKFPNTFYDSQSDELWAWTGSQLLVYRNGQQEALQGTELEAAVYCPSKARGVMWIGNHLGISKWKDHRLAFRSDWRQQRLHVWSLFEDRDTSLWVGAMSGLWHFNGSRLRHLAHEHPLLGQRVLRIAETPSGRMLLAIHDQGIVIRGKANCRVLNTSNGLMHNLVFDILVDTDSAIWVNTAAGLQYFPDEEALLQPARSKIRWHASGASRMVSDNAHLWTVRQDEVVRWDKALFQLEPTTPPIHLDRLEVNGRDTFLASGVSLAHDENTLVFHYSGIAPGRSEQLQYQYRLLGTDSTWQRTTERSAAFRSLKSKQYQFEVRAGYGTQWSRQPATFAFTIQSPIWLRWWFLLAAAILVGLLAAFFVRRYYRRRARQQATQVRLLELERDALRAQMHPHFIFNALNIVHAYIGNDQREDAQHFLTRFSRLVRLVLHNSSHQFVPFSDELEALRLYAEIEQVRFSQPFVLHFHVDPAIDQAITKIPGMLLQPYVENAILHGLLPSNRPGRLSVEFSANEAQTITCRIIDTGIGRDAAAARQPASSAHHSMGMLISKRRLELMNERVYADVNVKVRDRADGQTGTCVEVTLPIA